MKLVGGHKNTNRTGKLSNCIIKNNLVYLIVQTEIIEP